jgi:heat shock protein 4
MQDKLIADTLDRKNAVEAYVYETRDAVDMHLREFISDEDRSQFTSALNDAEDWLYGDGEAGTKSDFVKKLEELKVMGDPVELRYREADKRGPALAALKKAIQDCNVFVASEEEQYQHIGSEDRDKVANAASAAEKWLNENEAAQEAQPKTVPPLFLASAVESQTAPLLRTLKDVSSKPKPKPPKPEPEQAADSEEAPATEDEAPAEESTDAPADMDVD